MELQSIASIVVLLIIAAWVQRFSKHSNAPYTIILFIIGIVLGVLNSLVPLDRQIQVQLTPELLFFVFLPVLIFESGYNIKYLSLKKLYLPIRMLAIVWLILSATLIGGGSYLVTTALWITVPREILILFAIIISATDPVAVLSIAKNMGLPKRLRLILEWESLFNDATAVVLFFICLELIRSGFGWGNMLHGGIMFGQSIIFWIMFGIACGVLCSYVLKQFQNDTYAEITITMILAHATFLWAERLNQQSLWWVSLHVSGIIATAFAAIIMGNFGKTKISPKVEQLMESFWWFFSYVCNALLFLVMGMYVVEILALPFIYIILWGIFAIIMILARWISVVSTMSIVQRIQSTIPSTRNHLIARWWLRGALALVLVLMVPQEIYDHIWLFWWVDPALVLLSFVIISIFISLVFQWLTMQSLIKFFQLHHLKRYENFELREAEIIVYHRILEKLKSMKLSYTMSNKSYELLYEKYTSKISESRLHLQLFIQQHDDARDIIARSLRLHALWIEKSYLHHMYHYNEIPENLFHYLIHKIETQIERVKQWVAQINGFGKQLVSERRSLDPIMYLMNALHHTDHCGHDDFILNRTRMVLAQKVIRWMKDFCAIDFGYDDARSQEIILLYQQFYDHALQEIQVLEQHESNAIECIETALLSKGLAKKEEYVVQELYEQDIITEKIYNIFLQEVHDEVWKAY